MRRRFHHLPAKGALSLGLLCLLGCMGMMQEDDGLAEAPTGETGDTGQAPDEEEEEEEEVVDSAVDTGAREEKPDRGGRGKRPAPKPKPKAHTMCFGGGGLDLQVEIQGAQARGSLKLTGKVNVNVPKLTGSREGNRLKLSGTGKVNGKKKDVKVQAGKEGGGAAVRIDGHQVKGARKQPCP